MIESDRRRGRSRTRILYWFRTPPGVKVGRSALDPAAIRWIEESNPEIEFDWTRIQKEQGTAEPQPAAARPLPGGDRRSVRRPTPEPREPRESREPREPRESRGPRAAPPGLAAAPARAEMPPVMAMPEVDQPPEVVEAPVFVNPTPAVDHPPTAADARLGAEGVMRLRARHTEILARITERVAEPARQDELKAQAARLNPDSWVTDAEVQAGLEGYESGLEAIRAVVGQGRRRRRRSGGAANEPGSEMREAGETQETVVRSQPRQDSDGNAREDPGPEEEPV